ALTKWESSHNQGPTQGGFFVANRSQPHWKPWKPWNYFTDTIREVYDHLIQCRTCHGLIRGCYAISVPTENVQCPRGLYESAEWERCRGIENRGGGGAGEAGGEGKQGRRKDRYRSE
ncbi:hypothetical protein GYMLUDRAFT_174342, partial [Collybiopsis luxurians FD-317 M1]